ncbi:hypothetical protein PNQ29_00650 [Halobacterium salinarum]|uniref:hypothetical protein n=1 Tax=Halobacterium salinarum TaxID=2242 RepID=UPI0025558F92|nr:hypothetical protein [Halobacterium salinarum]MDL0118269.1 hypothetical protein [Halobacterium salinarum]
MSTNTNISNVKKVSLNKQQERWVIVQQDGDEVTTLNADAQEADNPFGISVGLGETVYPSTYDEIIKYRGANPEAVDEIGYYHKEHGLITGADADEIEEKIRSRIEEKEAQKQEARENIELPEDRISALDQTNNLLRFYEGDESFVDIAVDESGLRSFLDEEELNEVQRREKEEEYNRYNRDEDLYSGLPQEVEIVRVDGKYAREKEDDEEDYDFITNFVINTKAYLSTSKRSGDDDQLYEIEIVPTSPQDNPTRVVISADIFNEPRNFKDAICSKGRTLVFRGSSHDLPHLKELVGNQIAPEKEIKDIVGLHDGMMLTPEGVIDGDGWVPEDESEYVLEPEQEGNIIDDWDLDYDEEFEYDEEEVAQFIENYWQTRDPERILPLIGYVYASAFAPQVREIEGEWMNISISGDSGSGKSSTVEAIQKAIGLTESPNSLDDTLASMRNNLAATNNVPVWYDEYIPTRYGSYKMNQVKQYFKKTAKAEKASKSSEEHSNKQQRLKAPLIITGEQYLTGNADTRRAIQSQFTYAGRNEDRWDRLVGGYIRENGETEYIEGVDFTHHAKAFWKFILSFDAEEVQSMWRDAKTRAFDLREEYGYEDIQDLELNSLVSVLFGIELYRKLGEEVGADPEELPNESHEESTFRYLASQMGSSNRKSDLDRFIEYVAEAIQMGYIKKSDELVDGSDEGIYKIVNKGDPDEHLRFKRKQAHSKVSKFLKEHDIDIDLLDHQSYKDRMEDNDDYVHSSSQNTPPIGRCVSINTHDAEEHIEGFERNQIVPDAATNEEDEISEEDIPDDI